MLTARSTRSARSSISLSRKPRAIFAVSVSAVVFNVMGRADIYPVYDQTPADYSTFDRKITLRFASDGEAEGSRRGVRNERRENKNRRVATEAPSTPRK